MVKILTENVQESDIKHQIDSVIKNVQNKIIDLINNEDKYYTNKVFRLLIGSEYVDEKGNLIDLDTLDEEEKKIVQDNLSKNYLDADIASEINSIYKEAINDLLN